MIIIIHFFGENNFFIMLLNKCMLLEKVYESFLFFFFVKIYIDHPYNLLFISLQSSLFIIPIHALSKTHTIWKPSSADNRRCRRQLIYKKLPISTYRKCRSMDAGFIFSKYYVCYTIFECSGYKNSQCRRQCSELSAIFQVGKKIVFSLTAGKMCIPRNMVVEM